METKKLCTMARGCKNKATVFNIEEEHRVFACKLHKQELIIRSELVDLASIERKLPTKSTKNIMDWKDLLHKGLAFELLHHAMIANTFGYCDLDHITLAWNFLSYLTSGFIRVSEDGVVPNYKIPHVNSLKLLVNVDGLRLDMTKMAKSAQRIVSEYIFSTHFLSKFLRLCQKLFSRDKSEGKKKDKYKGLVLYFQEIGWLVNRMSKLIKSDESFDVKRALACTFDNTIVPAKVPNNPSYDGDIMQNARLYFRMGEYECSLNYYKIGTSSRSKKERYESILYLGIIRFLYGHYRASIQMLKYCKKSGILEYEALSCKYIAFNYAKMRDCKAAASWAQKAKFFRLNCEDVERQILYAQGDYKHIADHLNFQQFFKQNYHLYHLRNYCPFIADFYAENLFLIGNCLKHYDACEQYWKRMRMAALFSNYCPDNSPAKCEYFQFKASYYLFFNQLSFALEEITQAKAICEKIYEEDHDRTISILCTMGSIYLKERNYSQATKIFEDVLRRVQNKKTCDFDHLVAIGKYYTMIKQNRTAYDCFSKAIHNEIGMGRVDHPNVATVLVCMGKLYKKINDNNNAIKCYKRAMKIFKKQSMGIDTGRTCIQLFKTYRDLGMEEISLKYLSRARSFLNEHYPEKYLKYLTK